MGAASMTLATMTVTIQKPVSALSTGHVSTRTTPAPNRPLPSSCKPAAQFAHASSFPLSLAAFPFRFSGAQCQSVERRKVPQLAPQPKSVQDAALTDGIAVEAFCTNLRMVGETDVFDYSTVTTAEHSCELPAQLEPNTRQGLSLVDTWSW